MKPLPVEARTKNTGRNRDFCRWCGNTGYVAVATRPVEASAWAQQRGLKPQGEYEEMAPCPFCQRGYAEEFPEGEKQTAIKTPWGADGYWRGKDLPEGLTPLHARPPSPTPPAEAKRLLAELGVAVGAVGLSMEEAA